MHIGGPIYVSVNRGELTNGSSKTGYVLTIEPNFGVFVATGLELTVAFSYQLTAGQLYQPESSIGGHIGARYVFGWHGARVNPFVGILVGPAAFMTERTNTFTNETTQYTATFFDFGGRAGLLVPIARNVALEFGIGATFRTLLDGQSSYQSFQFFPAGLFGCSCQF